MDKTEKNYQKLSTDYYRIEKAIQYLADHYQEQPGLADVAQHLNLSEYHFQRLFRQWVGISPKRFLQFLTKEHAKALLEEREGVLDATFQSGLSSPGRLHDLLVTCDAVTPGEYKSGGVELTIHYGIHPSPFGKCLIGTTERGICGMVFLPEEGGDLAVEYFVNQWPNAKLIRDPDAAKPFIQKVFDPKDSSQGKPLPVYLRGTNFQIKVWEALMQVPSGSIVTYQDIAYKIGLPTASRAVGNAVSKNRIPVIIPCHRVIRKTGAYGGYRWGAARKKAMLGWEFAKAANQ